jgi:hypothetical protein
MAIKGIVNWCKFPVYRLSGIQSYEADQRKAGFSGKNVKPFVTLNILPSIAAEHRSTRFGIFPNTPAMLGD